MGPTNQPRRVPMNLCWEPSSLFPVFLRGGRQLHKTFQPPSVRHVQFIGGVLDLHNYFHATFWRMFPKLDTRPNPPFQCFKERQSCKEIERDALACSRKRYQVWRDAWHIISQNHPLLSPMLHPLLATRRITAVSEMICTLLLWKPSYYLLFNVIAIFYRIF